MAMARSEKVGPKKEMEIRKEGEFFSKLFNKVCENALGADAGR